MPEPRSLIDGKYEILDTIQEGEASAIYKVRHLHLDEVRVIKVMHSQHGASDEQARRFLQEAKTLTRLKHPNICTILDLFQDAAGTTYIVLEFIDGVNMSELLKASGLPSLPMALEIAHQTLLALGCLHRRNIIHRDIAPDNIMLTMDEEHEPHVKLIGLGVAKMLGGTVELTSIGQFVGKMKYSSPEQLGALDEGEKLDSRSDLYSLGVVLYQTLTGAMPIRGEQPREILVGHLSLPPIPFFKSDPEGKVPQEVAEIVMKALEKRREKRFNSAEEFDEQVVSLKNRFATREQSEITRPLTIGEAWRTPSRFLPSVSAAAERSNPESSPRTTPAVVPQRPLPAPTPPVPEDSTLVVRQPSPVPAPPVPDSTLVVQQPSPVPGSVVESPARAPTVPLPSSAWRRRRLPAVPGSVAAAGIVVAVLLLFFLRRSKPELRTQAAVPAPTPVVVAAASKPPAVTAVSNTRSLESPAPSEASRSMVESPAPVPEASMPAADEARLRASAARSAAEKEDARARAPNSYGKGRQKETEAQALFARQEYSFAETAFAAAEQLFRKAQESSAQSKREAARRQLSAPKRTPTAPVLAAGPAQTEPVAAPTAPPSTLQPPVLLQGFGPRYPAQDSLPPGPDEIVIVVRAVVTERGDVRDVQVPNVQHLVLDRPAIYAVQNWRFRPATLNGRPVEARIKVTSVVRRVRGLLGNQLKEVSRSTETIGLATPGS